MIAVYSAEGKLWTLAKFAQHYSEDIASFPDEDNKYGLAWIAGNDSRPMETIDVLGDSEETQLLTKWDPDKWISCGYYDVPPFVDTARRTMLEIPAAFAQKLPSKSMSISTSILEVAEDDGVAE
ncbi:hypothetical protein FB451DRAFT_1194096 [Mycena latifolia]|nr:hypothetical protein FB451DRAFT_1194096 [Mycena latifolia]